MFRLLKVRVANGERPVYLLVEGNGNVPFEYFAEKISNEGNYEIQLDRIQEAIHSRSAGDFLSESRFKSLKGRAKNDRTPDFEYRTKDLRVYSFAFENGEVIWDGEKKDPKRQSRTIARMRDVKKRFYEQLEKGPIEIIDEEVI